MVQIPLRRAHRLRAITLASPTKKLRPQPTERTPTAWHTNDEYKNAEASDEASASSAVANVSETRVLPILTSSPIVKPTLFLSPFSWAVSNSCHRDRTARRHTATQQHARPRWRRSQRAGGGNEKAPQVTAALHLVDWTGSRLTRTERRNARVSQRSRRSV